MGLNIMNNKYNKQPGGISRKNRALLDTLNRQIKPLFTIPDVAAILKIDADKARRLATYWASRGWLSRIKNGLYTTVSLGDINPAERKEDPWIVASNIFQPCYIGGWSACEYWGLTDQIFKDIVIFTSRKVRREKIVIQDTIYIVKNIKEEKLFGTKPIWKNQVKINVSDPSRTLVDILNEPYLGGGIRNTSEIAREYFESENKDETTLFDYIQRFGNRTVYKRLGYLLEFFKIASPNLLEVCKRSISSGYSNLDPGLPSKGKILRRWNLRINAQF